MFRRMRTGAYVKIGELALLLAFVLKDKHT